MERYRGVTASPAARGRPERIMNPTQPDWQAALASWLAPFLDHLGHKARRRMCPLYIAGLIGPGERKSIEPIAARMAPADYDQLHHFVCDGMWDPAPLEAELLSKADHLLGGPEAVLVIDDTALPKKGTHSVGVAHQYAGVLGKNANCQVLVSLTLARDEVPLPIALRLYLPERWTRDPERLQRAGVPETLRAHRSKPDIALAECGLVLGRGPAGRGALAEAQLGAGPQGTAQGGLRGHTRARGGWACGSPARAQQPAPSGRGGVAGGRASRLGRAQVLPVQPAARDGREATGFGDQGALGVRAGASAAEGRVGARPLRGPWLAGAASTCADDAAGVLLLAREAACGRPAGEKNR